MMHGHEKSNLAIVAVKPANKVEQPAAERSAAEAQPGSRKKLTAQAMPQTPVWGAQGTPVQLVCGLIRTKPMNDLGADGAPQA